MKHLFTTLALAVLTAFQAQAISFSIDRELSDRNTLVVDAYWGDYNHLLDTCYTEFDDLWAIEGRDKAGFIEVNIMAGTGGGLQANLNWIGFTDWEDRSFANASFGGFNGISIEERDQGARLTWSNEPQIVGVPDSSDTAILFGLAMGGLFAFATSNRKEVKNPIGQRET